MAHLILALLPATAYGAGQIHRWRFPGRFGLSTDPMSPTPAAVTTALATFLFVELGKRPGGTRRP